MCVIWPSVTQSVYYQRTFPRIYFIIDKRTMRSVFLDSILCLSPQNKCNSICELVPFNSIGNESFELKLYCWAIQYSACNYWRRTCFVFSLEIAACWKFGQLLTKPHQSNVIHIFYIFLLKTRFMLVLKHLFNFKFFSRFICRYALWHAPFDTWYK